MGEITGEIVDENCSKGLAEKRLYFRVILKPIAVRKLLSARHLLLVTLRK